MGCQNQGAVDDRHASNDVKVSIKRIISPEFQRAIAELADIPFPDARTNRKLALALKQTARVVADYGKTHAELMLRFGKSGEAGVVPAENIQAVRAELAKASLGMVEFDVDTVALPPGAIMCARSQVELDGFIELSPPPPPPTKPTAPPAQTSPIPPPSPQLAQAQNPKAA